MVFPKDLVKSFMNSLKLQRSPPTTIIQATTISPRGMPTPRGRLGAGAASTDKKVSPLRARLEAASSPSPSPSPAALSAAGKPRLQAAALSETAAAAASPEPSARSVAKERMRMVLSQQRVGDLASDLSLDRALLQEDVCAVVMRHVKASEPSDVSVSMRRDGAFNIFEMQVSLSEQAGATATA